MQLLVGIQGHGHGIDVVLNRPQIVILARGACKSIDLLGIVGNNQNERKSKFTCINR